MTFIQFRAGVKGRSVVPSGHTCISLRSPLAVLSSFGSNKTFGSQALNSILAADYSEVNLKIMYHFQYLSFFAANTPTSVLLNEKCSSGAQQTETKGRKRALTLCLTVIYTFKGKFHSKNTPFAVFIYMCTSLGKRVFKRNRFRLISHDTQHPSQNGFTRH